MWTTCVCTPLQALFLDVTRGGLQFSNLHVGQFPVSAALTMLAVDFVLYGLLAVYFDNVVPSKTLYHTVISSL